MKLERMEERELVALIDEAERDGLTSSGTFTADQERYLEYYQSEPFGDEIEGRSSVISTDVMDLVESDMPSLARVFLGAGDPVEFQADTANPEAIQEAKDKQAVVSHIIRTIPNSYRIQHDWLKSSELQDIAALEYGMEEIKKPVFKRYSGLNEDELASLITDVEEQTDVEKAEIVEVDEDEGSVLIRIIHIKKQYFIRNITVDDLILSKNAWNKDDAQVVGKRFSKTRSDLIAAGFSKELVDQLPTHHTTDSNESGLKQARYRQQGGEETESVNSWANEEVRGEDVYINVDYDGDGIAERRHVIKVGNHILENEAFDHVPYSFTSSMLMPNNIVGKSRSSMVMQYQRINSTLTRGSLDNIYAVNNPRHVYTDDIDVDDLLDIRLNGIVHSEGIPQQNLMTLETPYVSDKTLQVLQYMKGSMQSSTGAMNQNQALEADQLADETATRFKGMEDAGEAKIELVARNIAEGYRDLWQGIAWFATHFQDTKLEIRVLGREMAFEPTEWRFDSSVVAKVGTGAGDNDKAMTNLSGIYQIQSQLLAQGSTLTDQSKQFNTLAEMIRVTGRHDVSQFFNNPEQPEQIVEAERDMLKRMVQQMEAGQQNPLAEAAAVEAKGELEKTQMQQKFNAQLETMKLEADYQEKLRDAQLKYEQDTKNNQQKTNELVANLEFKYTELELKYNTDIVGKGQGL